MSVASVPDTYNTPIGNTAFTKTKRLGYEKKYIQINKNYTHLYYQMNFIENTDKHKSTLV